MIPLSYRDHPFTAVIIQHAIWLDLRFSLSYRNLQERRDRRAAVKLMLKPLRKQSLAPKLLVANKLCSDAAAFRHEQGLRRNNRFDHTAQRPPAMIAPSEVRP
jgi:transposase-like protein